ncbi:hypothetical protein GDO81_004523 [Engystomops pustulosus]|uniref:Uncharacterized protein n=1 Tax=Engystomops pustulosus TaxID=76066 RepID=A0AAV6ZYU0_ENGPU|nr:hypothetical protein GDO81_004523 [Engystomops pustulosus]
MEPWGFPPRLELLPEVFIPWIPSHARDSPDVVISDPTIYSHKRKLILICYIYQNDKNILVRTSDSHAESDILCSSHLMPRQASRKMFVLSFPLRFGGLAVLTGLHANLIWLVGELISSQLVHELQDLYTGGCLVM